MVEATTPSGSRDAERMQPHERTTSIAPGGASGCFQESDWATNRSMKKLDRNNQHAEQPSKA
jgi:hypothetical protein